MDFTDIQLTYRQILLLAVSISIRVENSVACIASFHPDALLEQAGGAGFGYEPGLRASADGSYLAGDVLAVDGVVGGKLFIGGESAGVEVAEDGNIAADVGYAEDGFGYAEQCLALQAAVEVVDFSEYRKDGLGQFLVQLVSMEDQPHTLDQNWNWNFVGLKKNYEVIEWVGEASVFTEQQTSLLIGPTRYQTKESNHWSLSYSSDYFKPPYHYPPTASYFSVDTHRTSARWS